MWRALRILGLCGVLAACWSGGGVPASNAKASGTSAAVRAIETWCGAREAEVTPAEMAAIRGREERQRARFVKVMQGSDANSDPFALAQKSIKAMLREEGLMLQLPLPGEVSELLRRLNRLPAGSAARVWGAHLAALRAALFVIDATYKRGEMHADDANGLPKHGAIEAEAAQAGLAACSRMALAPAEARMYAQIALSSIGAARTAGAMAASVRRREPWLIVRVEPNACAVPAIGDPAVGERLSSYSAGIWRASDGTFGVTVSNLEDGGTLTRTPSGARWAPFAVALTAAGAARRVGPCPG
jgi:hypothetical protein